MKSTRSMVYACLIVAAAASLFASGCRRMFGMATINLKDKQIMKIQAGVVSTSATACPGQPVQLKIQAFTGDNVVFQTWEMPATGKPNKNDKVDFDQFLYTPSVGSVDKAGFFNPPADAFASFDQPYTIHVTQYYNSANSASITLNPDYSCIKYTGWQGASGVEGYSGQSGYSGSSGAYGSSSQNGGNGSNGSDGQDGSPGGVGENGPHVEVFLAYIKSQYCGDLVVIKVQPAGNPAYAQLYVTTPEVGSVFTVDVSGGQGGAGGRGGDGGSGGSGGTGFNGGDGANGGNGGNGSNGGNGGSGGTATIVTPSEHPEIAQFVTVVNEGGAAGPGGYGGSGGYRGSGGSYHEGGVRGRDGHSGNGGYNGNPGMPGQPGSPPTNYQAPLADIFGQEISSELPIF